MISPSANTGNLPRRAFGRSGVDLSIIGMGGIVVKDAEQDHANRVVAEFVERGVNYFDVAPSYGNAEEKLGPALEPHRQKVFLACKTTERTAAGAAAELKKSLQQMRTDYFDLYQLHALIEVEKDVDAVFAKGGAMETFLDAKKSGQIRHLGFSAHSVEAALAALDRFPFDSILFPISFSTYFAGHFGAQVIARAQEKGVAILALKALARQRWPEGNEGRKHLPKCWYEPLSDPREAELGLRFTLSQPVTAAIPPGEESLFRMALDFAERFQPITEVETRELEAMASGLTPLFRA